MIQKRHYIGDYPAEMRSSIQNGKTEKGDEKRNGNSINRGEDG